MTKNIIKVGERMYKYKWDIYLDLPFDKFIKIDAHAHIQNLGYPFNVGISEEEFIKIMDVYNIEKAVVCDINNDAILKSIKKHPKRLIGIVWVDPRDENAKNVVMQYINEGFRGIKLHPLLHMFSPSSEPSKRILSVAQDLGVPVFIHSGHPPTSLPWQIDDLARSFPDVPIVMVHMGHGNAFYIQGAIEIAERLENIYLETSGMPMSSKIAEAYEAIPDRIMFGTDIPCHHPAVEITKIIASGILNDALRKVFYENAKKLLNI